MADELAAHDDGIGWATGGGKCGSVAQKGQTDIALRESWVHPVLHDNDLRKKYLARHESAK